MKRIPYRFESHIGDDDVYFLVSGEQSQRITQFYRPSSNEIRKMLHEIRNSLRMSTSHFGMLLGVPLTTARAWLDGKRNPSGASPRLVWLMHTNLFHPEILQQTAAWMRWERPNRKLDVDGMMKRHR